LVQDRLKLLVGIAGGRRRAGCGLKLLDERKNIVARPVVIVVGVNSVEEVGELGERRPEVRNLSLEVGNLSLEVCILSLESGIIAHNSIHLLSVVLRVGGEKREIFGRLKILRFVGKQE
jgi:hypothetical protein